MRASPNFRRFLKAVTYGLTVGAALILSGCGGGKSENSASMSITPPGETCGVESEKTALREYMQQFYFWTGQSPNPEPAGYDTVEKYFDALQYKPLDRWSYVSDTAAYDQFFVEGKTLGYGVSVNGLESQQWPLPIGYVLRIRYVDPNSPAAAVSAGLQRGDEILAINGVSASVLSSTRNFAALSPAKEGDTIAITIKDATGSRVVSLSAATYDLKPVAASAVLTMGNGSKVGYVSLKEFVTQAKTPLEDAINTIRTEGAKDIIVDLRYNGGGLITTATVLASLIAGQQHDRKVFTSLKYNAKQSQLNSDYIFSAKAPGFSRVVVLTGQRTCSASELLVNGLNGLKPDIQVITIGASTCGKPFGFRPVELCGKTYSAVNFESVNAKGEGRYYTGLAPTCAVAETFTGALGSAEEVLTAAATGYLQNGTCPSIALAESRMLATRRPAAGVVIEPGEFRGMRAD